MAANSLLTMVTVFTVLASIDGATLNAGAGSMPSITNLDAKCGRSGMTVHISFDQPFPGIIYSKGFYSQKTCNYVTEKMSGKSNYTFLIPVNKCGTDGQLEEPKPGRDMYFENTIIIQMDPLITEMWDEARRLKCIWPHTLMRRVQASPIIVQDPERVSVKLDELSVNTLMAIQEGSGGPFTAPALGYVYMGEESSLVMYIQDPTKTKDANVVNCGITMADGRSEQLIDDFGCLMRPDLMTYFDKSRTSNGVEADLMLYSYLKGMRMNEDTKFTIKCQLEVCNGACNPPCSSGPVYSNRKRRSVGDEIFGIPSNSAIDEAILIVEKEQLPYNKYPECALSKSVLISGLILLTIIGLLSILSCFLAFRLSKATARSK